MTLHIYGRTDGTWLTLSDSWTTSRASGGKRVVKNPDTTKYLTFPTDHTSWKPGDFAAIAMTYGRAEFRKPNCATNDTAISVLQSGLTLTPAPAITSLSELVDHMWMPVFELMRSDDGVGQLTRTFTGMVGVRRRRDRDPNGRRAVALGYEKDRKK